MKRKRFSVEQITNAIQQHEAGLSVAEVCRKLGIRQRAHHVVETLNRIIRARSKPD